LSNKDEFLLNQIYKLISEISHEIKNPIGTSITATSLLKNKSKEIDSLFTDGKMTKQNLADFIGIVKDSSEILEVNLNRATDLIQSFKQINALQSRKEKTTFSLYEHITNIVKSLTPRLKKKNTQVTITGDENLEVNLYPDKIFQVIDNLIINSVTHGFVDKEDGHINIDFKIDDDKLVIVYSDNGCGIEENHQKHIFDEFYTTNSKNGSTGLGMHIVHSIITKDLEGSIELDTTPGEGTSFKIVVPT
jgi:signal transduction histidine kinase